VRLIHFEQKALAAVEALHGQHERNTTVLKKRMTGLTQIVDGLLDEIDRLESLNNAFEAGNLLRLVEWANSVAKDGTRYRQGHNGIIAEPDRADPIVLSFPADYSVPSREPFRTFRAAITG